MTTQRRLVASLALAFCTLSNAATPAAAAPDATLPAAILAAQPKATSQKANTADGAEIELVDLNPSIGRWFLLRAPNANGQSRWAHLDLGQEGISKASLSVDGNLRIDRKGLAPIVCPLNTPEARLTATKTYSEPFTSFCNGAVFIRSKPSKSYKSNVESVTDWLREQGPLGEQLITWRKDLFPHVGDNAEAASESGTSAAAAGPLPAATSGSAPANLATGNLGLKLAAPAIKTGSWAPIPHAPGVFASISAPSFAPAIFSDHSASSSLAYFMAFELAKLDPRYSVGVDHPAVGWSSRAPGPHDNGGPDGFATIDPLDRVGMVPPWAMTQLAAVVSGGFKREHSAFKAGPLSSQNHGTHYGFAEAGVVLSRINPGLATFYQRIGEAPNIKTWTADDEAKGVDKLIFARQNGLLLLENGAPGKDLAINYNGNWSGNQEGSPMTMRSSLCISENAGRKYLMYGVFSNAVPKDMAQLLKAYGCQQAMQLDMNAPSLTYAAVVIKDEKGQQRYMPLLSSMDDKNFGGTGRFTNTPDTRDFIYFEKR